MSDLVNLEDNPAEPVPDVATAAESGQPVEPDVASAAESRPEFVVILPEPQES